MKYLYKIYTMICICCLATSTITAQLTPVNLQKFKWAKSMGNVSFDGANSVAVDASGNVYATGYFEGTVDFDPDEIGVHELESAGSYDIFISKLDALGNFIWAKKMGGEEADAAHSITLDPSGNAYTTGYFSGAADFDPDDVNEYDLDSNGGEDIFVSKLDASGNFVWAKRMGGPSDDQAKSIALDVFENVYTTGFFQDTADFDPDEVGIHNLNSSGYKDIFVSKLDDTGSFLGVKKMGGDLNDVGNSIVLDDSGNIYATGSFEGAADFNPKTAQYYLFSAGKSDIFISKLDSQGNLVGARRMGGTLHDAGTSITLGIAGNIYTTGSFEGTADFDPDPVATFNLSQTGGWVGARDVFVSKLDSSGNFIWAKNMGGSGLDSAFSIIVDHNANVYTTGYFTGIAADFDPGTGTFGLDSEGGLDIFISKLSDSGNFKWAKRMGGEGNDTGKSITVDASANVYTTGYFEETTDFDPGIGIDEHFSDGFSDIFIQKLGNPIPVLPRPFPHIVSVPVVYPNPTAQNLTLDLGVLYNKVTLSIRNFGGKLVSTKDYKKVDKIDYSIKGSPGMYFVEVWIDGKKSTTLKVLKQ